MKKKILLDVHKESGTNNLLLDSQDVFNFIGENTYGEHNKQVARSHCKKVYCIELDRVFESAKQAAMQLDLSDSNIAKCCKGKYKTTGGYHWEYVDDNLVKEMVGDME